MDWKSLWEFVKNKSKKNYWYFFLLTISSIYVYRYRYDIYQMTELDAHNLVFILWIILLGLPLFSQIEVGNIKLKREIEQNRAEMKESISDLKYQILHMKVDTSAASTVYVNSQPLPSRDELSEIQKNVADSTISPNETINLKVPEENLYLFKVRLSLEKQLLALCNFFAYDNRRSVSLMTQFLLRHEVIEYNVSDLIREIVNIANRGVHGEIIDEDYINFVKNTYPLVKKILDKKYKFYSNNRYFCTCPRCKYEGPSKYKNECPKCGFIFDDE